MKWKICFKRCCYLTSNVITPNSVRVKKQNIKNPHLSWCSPEILCCVLQTSIENITIIYFISSFLHLKMTSRPVKEFCCMTRTTSFMCHRVQCPLDCLLLTPAALWLSDVALCQQQTVILGAREWFHQVSRKVQGAVNLQELARPFTMKIPLNQEDL